MIRSNVYKAVWRWHFYAGLLTLPFLVLLACTGSIYLFKDEINQLRYGRLLHVEPSGDILPASKLVEAGLAGRTDAVIGYVPPAGPDSSARVVVKNASGASHFVFIDPYRGVVLGEVERGQFGNLPLMELVRSLHSLEIAGPLGNRLVEVVAGWAVMLVLSGFYLWWPRGQGGVVRVRRNAGHRTFWRDLHAVTGVFAGCLILFLALTGLPWSGFWGENLKHLVNEAGLGYPAGYWFPVVPSETPTHHEAVIPAGWTLENQPLPNSSQNDGLSLGLDEVLGIYAAAGMHNGYAVSFPVGARGVWSASVIPDKVQNARTMHLDQYSGEVLADIRYGDLGVASKAIEWGTSVHTGQQFGRLNQLVMLIACIAIVCMSLSAVLMWWKRRPPGRMGAPSYSVDAPVPRALLFIPVIAGLVFPLVGLSILLVLLIDALLGKMLNSRPT